MYNGIQAVVCIIIVQSNWVQVVVSIKEYRNLCVMEYRYVCIMECRYEYVYGIQVAVCIMEYR